MSERRTTPAPEKDSEYATHPLDRRSVSPKMGEESSPQNTFGSSETPITAKPAKPDSRFKPFTLKPYAPARDLTQEEIREREELQARLFGKS